MSGVFTGYQQNENRVTATLLAVLSQLSFVSVDRLIGRLLVEDNFQLIKFSNQQRLSSGSTGRLTPDARIFADFSLWIETKIVSGAITQETATKYLEELRDRDRLLFLTPDAQESDAMLALDDPRVSWSSFRKVAEAIDDLLLDQDDPPSEREAFLLRHFVRFLEAEKLLMGPEDVVLIVAARSAWPEYERFRAYICQPNRSFRAAGWMGFYANKVLHGTFPRILGRVEEITLSEEGIEHALALGMLEELHRQRMTDLLNRLQDEKPERIGQTNKVIFLASEEDSLTVGHDIVNDTPSAFVQGHRYIPRQAIDSKPTTISELKKATTA